MSGPVEEDSLRQMMQTHRTLWADREEFHPTVLVD
jgi:hypothetical protein